MPHLSDMATCMSSTKCAMKSYCSITNTGPPWFTEKNKLFTLKLRKLNEEVKKCGRAG